MLSEQLAPLIVTRLRERAAFGGRVELAGDLAALMRSGDAAQPILRAHVIPAQLTGRQVESAAGAFVQAVERGVTVLITLPAFDGSGVADGDRMEGLVLDTVLAIAGWAPDSTPGVFRLVQGRLLSMARGVMVYQLDFSVADQLRIAA